MFSEISAVPVIECGQNRPVATVRELITKGFQFLTEKVVVIYFPIEYHADLVTQTIRLVPAGWIRYCEPSSTKGPRYSAREISTVRTTVL